MSDTVQMPALGESVTEGTVTRWLKAVGETVELDEPLLEVSTDKVDTEIPSPFAGVLEKILVEEDETVEVGAALAEIGSGEGAGSSDDAKSADEAPAPQAPAEVTDEAPARVAATRPPHRRRRPHRPSRRRPSPHPRVTVRRSSSPRSESPSPRAP